MTGHGKVSGPVADNQYLLYIERPDDQGVFREADGFGGTITYSYDFHTGPLTTSRRVCDAAAAQGLSAQEWTPYNRTNTFDYQLLTAPAPAPTPTEQPAPSLGVPASEPAPAPENHILRTIIIEIAEGISITIILGGMIGAGAKAYRVSRAARIAREVEETTEAVQALRAIRRTTAAAEAAEEEYIRRLVSKGIEQLTDAETASLQARGRLPLR